MMHYIYSLACLCLSTIETVQFCFGWIFYHTSWTSDSKWNLTFMYIFIILAIMNTKTWAEVTFAAFVCFPFTRTRHSTTFGLKLIFSCCKCRTLDSVNCNPSVVDPCYVTNQRKHLTLSWPSSMCNRFLYTTHWAVHGRSAQQMGQTFLLCKCWQIASFMSIIIDAHWSSWLKECTHTATHTDTHTHTLG